MTCFHMREKEHYLSFQALILLLIKSVGNLSLVSKRVESCTINLKLSFQGVRFLLTPAFFTKLAKWDKLLCHQ